MTGKFMLAAAAALLASTAQAAERRSYANPVDIDYRYNWEQVAERRHRRARRHFGRRPADPLAIDAPAWPHLRDD